MPDCLAFDRNPTKFYTLLTLLFGRISSGAIISHHLKSICLPFENHFFLIINQRAGYPAIYIYIFLLYIFQKFCCLKKLQRIYCFHKNVLYLQNIVLTCNIWKHLCWTHFYNLVASFRRVQQQKRFVMLSRFWLIRGGEGGGSDECIKICDENVAVSYLINF